MPEPQDALLVVELSDYSLGFDQTTKLALYARHGIEEYWVIDVAGERIHVYRNPVEAGYAERVEVAGEEVVAPRAVPQLRLTVRDLFASFAK